MADVLTRCLCVQVHFSWRILTSRHVPVFVHTIRIALRRVVADDFCIPLVVSIRVLGIRWRQSTK